MLGVTECFTIVTSTLTPVKNSLFSRLEVLLESQREFRRKDEANRAGAAKDW